MHETMDMGVVDLCCGVGCICKSGAITWQRVISSAVILILVVFLLPLQHFDTDHSGYITEENLEAALKEHCPTKAMLAKQIKSIMLEVDTNHDGVIDFQEFCHMMCATAQPAAVGAAPTGATALPRAKTARKGQLLPNDGPDDTTLLQQLSLERKGNVGGKGGKGVKDDGKGGLNRSKTIGMGQLTRAKTARKGHLDVAGLLGNSQGNLLDMGK